MYFKTTNMTFYYEKHGNNKNTIIILPGWGNTRNTFYNIIKYLKEDFTIFIIDYPGEGNSPIPNKTLTIYDYAKAIKLFLEQKEIKKPIIIAHSFGGRISSILIGKYNVPIKKLLLIDVAGIKRRKKLNIYIKEKTYKLLKKISIILPKKRQKKWKTFLINTFSSPDYKDLSPTMQKTFQNILKENLKEYYRKIKTETLIIWGEKDQDTPLKDGILLRKIIKNSALIIYKKASHYSYLEYPTITNKIIYEFIKEKD